MNFASNKDLAYLPSSCPKGEDLLCALVLGGELILTKTGWKLERTEHAGEAFGLYGFPRAPYHIVEWLLESGFAVQANSGRMVRVTSRGRSHIASAILHSNDIIRNFEATTPGICKDDCGEE